MQNENNYYKNNLSPPRLTREDIVKAISGILIVFAFIAVISLFANIGGGSSNDSNPGSNSGGSSSDGSENDSGTTITYKLSGIWVFDSLSDTPSDIHLNINFNSNGQSFTSAEFDTSGAEWVYYGDVKVWGGSTGWTDQAYRTITFDGTQTVSEEFYEWFTANAVKQEQTYQLSGQWEFNTNLSYDNEISAEINFTSNDMECSKIIIMNTGYLLWVKQEDDMYMQVWSEKNSWDLSFSRIIDFGSIPQTVSKEFYEWFTANANPSVSDLTGYTVTIPAGWSATAGYGEFSLVGYVDIYSNNLEEETNTPKNFLVGYFSESPPWTPRVSSDSLTYHKEVDSEWYDRSSEESFVLVVEGGADATNSSLIQWLVDNNATFEKTGG